MPAQTPFTLGVECLKAGQMDEAIEHLEKATVHFPEDYQGFNYLGVAYAKKGLPNKAIGALQAAAQLKPNMPSIHYNLGLAYQADGFPDKAKEEFEHALKLDATYQKAADALKALDARHETDNWLSAQSCARHPDEPAIAQCSFCRLPVCSKCKTIVRGQIYCNFCAEKQK